MNVRALVLAAAFLAVSASLSAQENETKEPIGYSNVTEFGLLTASPMGVSLEGTTAHGFSINKQHHFGFGTGIGVNFSTNHSAVTYMPIFLNYRVYFKPEKTFSPQFNIALGGLVTQNGFGAYSSVTMGFRAGKFSFSSGLSCMPINDWFGWAFPLGITLKWGFAF